jgi:hypothetical protein
MPLGVALPHGTQQEEPLPHSTVVLPRDKPLADVRCASKPRWSQARYRRHSGHDPTRRRSPPPNAFWTVVQIQCVASSVRSVAGCAPRFRWSLSAISFTATGWHDHTAVTGPALSERTADTYPSSLSPDQGRRRWRGLGTAMRSTPRRPYWCDTSSIHSSVQICTSITTSTACAVSNAPSPRSYHDASQRPGSSGR